MKQHFRGKKPKRFLSFLLSLLLMLGSLAWSPGTLVTAEAADLNGEELRELIATTAMQYVGYNYGQSNRNVRNGVIDCSLLVQTVLQTVGYGNVPSSTDAWASAIRNHTLNLTYNGKALNIGYDVPEAQETSYDLVVREYTNADSYEAVAKEGDIYIEDGHAAITIGTLTNVLNLSDRELREKGVILQDFVNEVGGVSKGWFSDLTQLKGNITVTQLVNSYNAWTNLILPKYGAALSSGRAYPSINSTELMINAWNSATAGVSLANNYKNTPQRTSAGGQTVYAGLIIDFTEKQLAAGVTPSNVWRVEGLNESLGIAITNNMGGKEAEGGRFWAVTIPDVQVSNGSAHIEAYKVLQDASGNPIALSGNEFKLTVENISYPNKSGVTAAGTRTAYNDASGRFIISPDYNFQWIKGALDETGDWIFKITESAGTNPLPNVTYQDPKYFRINVAKDPNDDTKLVCTRYVGTSTTGPWTAYTDYKSITFTNVQNSSGVNVTVSKVDQNGNPVAGVTYTVYSSFNSGTGALSGVLGTMTTGEDGKAIFSKSDITEAGSLYIKETAVPANTTMVSDVIWFQYGFNVVNGTTYFYPMNQLVFAYNNATGAYQSPNTRSDAVTINSSSLSEDRRTISYSFTMVNQVTYSGEVTVKIHKVDENGAPLRGVTFTLYDSFNTSTGALGNVVATLTTDANGDAVWTYSSTATGTVNWYFTETAVPTGIKKDDSVTRIAFTKASSNGNMTVSSDGYWYYTKQSNGSYVQGSSSDAGLTVSGSGTSAMTYSFHRVDERYEANAIVNIHKTDETGQALANVEFTLYGNFNSATGELSDPIATITTNASGDGSFKYTTNAAESETWYLKETKAPAGIKLDDSVTALVFTSSYSNSGPLVVTNNLLAYYIKQTNGKYAQENPAFAGVAVVNSGTASLTYVISRINYHEKATGSTTLAAFKQFEKQLSGGEFSFLITNTTAPAGNEKFSDRTVSNKADGTVDFGSFEFIKDLASGKDMTGTWIFEVSEIVGNTSYIGYDDTVYTVTITVTDQNDGTLFITRSVNNIEYTPTAMTFINTYQATGSITLAAFKQFDHELLGGDFTFQLVNVSAPSGNSLFADRIVTNAADGTVDFGSFEFMKDLSAGVDMTGTWIFEVSEIAGDLFYVGYDSTVYTVTITVTDQDDGTLLITGNVDEIEYSPTVMTFINIWNGNPELPFTGGPGTFIFYGISLLGLIAAVVLLRKGKKCNEAKEEE